VALFSEQSARINAFSALSSMAPLLTTSVRLAFRLLFNKLNRHTVLYLQASFCAADNEGKETPAAAGEPTIFG